MAVSLQKPSKTISFVEEIIHVFALFRKSIILIVESRSWTALGLRILKRLYSGKDSIPFYMRWLFPKSNAWIEVRLAVENGDGEDVLRAVQHLVSYKNVYFDYSLIEFKLDDLLNKIEEKSQQAFKLLYLKKMKLFTKGSDQYEIHNSYYLKIKSNIKFHIDPKRFLFLLPVKYLFKTQEHKDKRPDYEHTFSLPSKINEPNNQKYTSIVEGDKIWELNNVKLIRGYQLINAENYLSYEKSADPVHKFIAGYSDSPPSYRLIENTSYVKVSVNRYEFQDLENIFLVSGRCSRNYFHWLIEYMPKMLWFLRHTPEPYQNCQIAVDSLMPPQHYQLLNHVMNKLSVVNSVIRINPDENIYNVKNIFVCSNPTFIPDSFEDFSYAQCSALNLESLSEFRKLFINDLSNKQDRKIYLARRNYSSRRLVNEPSIIEMFVRNGFEVVYAEQYTFEEQMNLFNSAKFIAGSSGAAFSNLIFCQENTVVINFLAEEIKEFAVFSNLCALSHSQYYVETGRLLKDQSSFLDRISWLYSDFEIDENALELKLKQLLSQHLPRS